MTTPGIFEKGRRPDARLAEVEIVAGDDGLSPEPAHQDVFDETLGRHRRHRLVEGEQDHAVDAERLEQARLVGCRRQPEDRPRAVEIVARVRLEGDRRAGAAERVRARLRTGDHRLVAAVDAVEIADREHGMRKAGWQAFGIDGDDEAPRLCVVGQNGPGWLRGRRIAEAPRTLQWWIPLVKHNGRACGAGDAASRRRGYFTDPLKDFAIALAL